MKDIQQKINDSRTVLEHDFSVKKIGVFGSFAKGLATKDSDIDFLVELKEPIGLFRFASLRLFLEDCFKQKVDIATPRALKPIVRDEIMGSIVYL